MDYYEEFEVARAASADEIRRAYRNLARLLHPDQQPDETLRRLAGVQMVRLNLILQTLTDPKLRRQYDMSLRGHAANLAVAMTEDESRAAASSNRWPDSLPSHGFRWSSLTWLGAGFVVLGGIAWFLAQDAAVQRPLAGADANISGGPQQSSESGAWPSPSRGSFASRNQIAVRGGGSRAGGDLVSDGFAGKWSYAGAAEPEGVKGLCPPVYIEVQISEAGGQITGRYSAKYKVADRAISPFVSFHFAGPARAPVANLVWSGSGGATGHVRLALLAPRSLHVDWSAEELGSELGLVSGMATLTRRDSP